MSYDVSLTIKTGKEETEVTDCGNYTYNASSMYQHAMGASLGEFNGTSCKTAIPILKRGVKEMINNPGIHRALQPENGWGNYEGALKFLETILSNCEKYYKCTIRVN